MPLAVRRALEERFGSTVTRARSQSGGFSPGVAARVHLADGTRAFVKAACSVPNPVSPVMHRREARVAAALPGDLPAPGFRFVYDDGEWVALAFDDIDGRSPLLPWRTDELERVLSALQSLSEVLTPSPVALEPAADRLAPLLGGWRRIAEDGALAALPAGPTRFRLGELVGLEARWPDAVPGVTLVHLDLRADNIVLTADRVFVIDWTAAAVGAAWLDLVAMLPSVAMQGGPDPETVWRAHPLSRGVDDEQLDAFVAALAGYFVQASLLPAPPGLPTLRPFQAGQGERSVAWLARRRGWSEFAE